ncbi:MAG: thiolase family protein [Thermoplasmata archaeon]|nr:thiolase family protein [Thermoplasmata archaeon]MCI4341930.1 thiolase family protein [Thermoplasmata archaeon]
MSVHVSAAIAGRVGRRPEGLVDLMAEVGERALEEVGRRPIDLLIVGSMAAGPLGGVENLVPQLADRLNLEGASGVRVDAASASGAAAFHTAARELASGRAERALVLAGEKMTARSTAEVTAVLARSLAPSEQSAGATMPALAALVAQRYQHRFALEPAAFDAVTVQFRRSAQGNPNAQFPTPVSPEEVRASRTIAAPLRLLHCSAISDGAAAVILERGSGPASVLGLGQGLDALALTDRGEVTSFKATRTAAQRAYEQARLTRKEVEFAEVHDAFAPFALVNLEDLGFCGAGEAARWFLDGWTAPGGRFPVNPSGGLLGRGHPVGASGLLQIAEVARQLRGESGALALPQPPAVGLAQSIGGLGAHVFVSILGPARTEAG